MRRAFAVLGCLALVSLGAVSFTVLPNSATRAAGTPESATYLIPATEGYGVADCLATATECGKVIANAWCEAHGYARAASFGLAAAEDLTGSIATPAPAARAERPLSITCSE